MLFGRKASHPLQPGDQFIKAGVGFGTVWEIVRVWTTGDELLHARLRSLENNSETMAISVCTLVNPRFFTPVPRLRSSGDGGLA
ncbi:hypothetical protein [Magnetospirillum sulfuroxidans]|uniref:Uncharacterized protein n=1 Tax=Magnetospirillum sulfuroxidans TaxID=611300 RepID=A0ABS5I8W7_9PROT|nr:hypothetical protein [Magnetospirillum sulfuroxidans]MBR9970869.1 hypothetical protein [Magnetospirillum sulfuroxidans]